MNRDDHTSLKAKYEYVVSVPNGNRSCKRRQLAAKLMDLNIFYLGSERTSGGGRRLP